MSISRFRRFALAVTMLAAIAVAAGCSSPLPEAASSAADPGIPDGAYRTDWTAEQLVAVGASSADAVGNAGIRTLTIDSGEFVLAKDSATDCTGTVSAVGARARFEVPVGDCNGATPLVFEMAWALDSGLLTLSDFTLVEPDDPTLGWLDAFFTSQPWTALE